MTQDYDIIIHVSHDRFGQRSAAVATSPEGMPAGEVNEVLSQLRRIRRQDCRRCAGARGSRLSQVRTSAADIWRSWNRISSS